MEICAAHPYTLVITTPGWARLGQCEMRLFYCKHVPMTLKPRLLYYSHSLFASTAGVHGTIWDTKTRSLPPEWIDFFPIVAPVWAELWGCKARRVMSGLSSGRKDFWWGVLNGESQRRCRQLEISLRLQHEEDQFHPCGLKPLQKSKKEMTNALIVPRAFNTSMYLLLPDSLDSCFGKW